MITQKTLAFVLHRRPWKEFHQVLWLFTETHGLLPVVAYGIAHFGSKRSSHLDIGNLCEIELEKRKQYWSVRNAQAIQTYYPLKKDLTNATVFLAILKLLSKVLPIEMALPKIFRYILETLGEFSRKTSLQNFTKEEMKTSYRNFERKMLELLGYAPPPELKLRPDWRNMRPDHIRDELERSEETLELFV